jgi:hypothetical protein
VTFAIQGDGECDYEGDFGMSWSALVIYCEKFDEHATVTVLLERSARVRSAVRPIAHA